MTSPRRIGFAATAILIGQNLASCAAFSPAASTYPSFSFALNDAVNTPVEPPLNPLLSQIKPSKTVEVFSLVKQMEAEGETVTSLCVGEPDFAPPQCVLDAATAAMNGGQTRYTAVTGTDRKSVV